MIRLEGVSHTYKNGTVALRDVDLKLNSNDFTVLIGPSGAGKSTLMRVLNGLVKPSNGLVWLNDLEVTHANETQVRLERRSIGMVFQQFNLVKRMTALENVLIGRLGFMTAWRSTFKAYTRADRELAFACLERVGMSSYAWQRADTLSGGQQQRVGIARALAQQPKLILADEPISALDPKSADQVMELLQSIQQDDGIAVVTNLHHLERVREVGERVIALKRGRVVFDGSAMTLSEAVVRELYYDDMSEVDHLEGEQIVVMRPGLDKSSLEPKKSAVTKLNSPSFLPLRNGEVPYPSDPYSSDQLEPLSPSKFSSAPVQNLHQSTQVKKEWEK
jgi:phosphonate transport system ATP-binding protein